MKEFVWKIPHLHNIFPNPNLPLEQRLAKRWIVQVYIPEVKVTHLENNKMNEVFLAFDNRFILKFGQYSFDFGFNLFGFGLGVSRKTDEMLASDAQHIQDIQKRIGA